MKGATYLFTVFLAVFAFSLPTFADEKGHIPAPPKSEDTIITVIIENDSIGTRGTDKNYTSGVRLGYYDINAELPEIAYIIDDYIPTFEITKRSSVFYSLGQNLYTPQDITQTAHDPDDRPWAAHLYGSMGLVTQTDNHLDELEVSIGVVGPAALGEQAQKFVHKYVTPDSPTPKGWSHQLKNEPALMIGWQRRYYPESLSAEIFGLSASASPYFGATLGNVHTFANAGLNFRLTPYEETRQDAPMRVRPALPGTGYFEPPKDSWSWYAFAGIETRAVARNIFLDGNTLADSHSVDKKYLVADANAGLALTYDRYRISYTLVYRTREFDGQDEPSVFGALTFGYRF
ncbi:lipid A deacylase LpxR family protein [Sneathiella glossodoripedis]|uniref:lipid A deacylase LpxR family protein n=1 Tax=Sneathiella glossodoripedis TaxID=418853 RepID=UPI000472ED36|nr:lipid A deacylase LpxR family protein [Sneathiella glossodoripedis]